MSNPIRSELWVPAGRASSDLVVRAVDLLLARGFRAQRFPGASVVTWQGGDQVDTADWRDAPALSGKAGEWALELWAGEGEDAYTVLFHAPTPSLAPGRQMVVLGLSMPLASLPETPTQADAFRLAFLDLAALARPAMGRAGDEIALYELHPMDGDWSSDWKVPAPHWITVLGPEYTRRVEIDRLLALTAWRCTLIAPEVAAVVVARDPRRADERVRQQLEVELREAYSVS